MSLMPFCCPSNNANLKGSLKIKLVAAMFRFIKADLPKVSRATIEVYQQLIQSNGGREAGH
jgi:hypothetical protein